MKNKITNSYALFLTAIFLLSVFLTACNQNRTVQIKAALIYKMGAAQPVARTKFYLLNKDLKTFEENLPAQKSPFISPSFVKDLASVLPERKFTVGMQEENIKEFIVATTTTDFEGNAKFENVPNGTYYICGFTTTRSKDGYVVWSLKVNSGNATEPILLDQNNAFKAEEY